MVHKAEEQILPYSEVKAHESRHQREVTLMDDSSKMIIERLSDRIDKLESGNAYQMEYLLNISHVLKSLKEDNTGILKEYNNKIIHIENKLNELHELQSQLKTTCNTMNTELFTSEYIKKRVESIIIEYLGTAVSKEDVAKIVQDVLASTETKDDVTSDQINVDSDITEHVRRVVKGMLKVYDADKTGRVDYALESAGGQIISTRCTQRYDVKSRAMKLLGFTLYLESNNPRTVIQGNPIQPGACWAFQDFPGYLLIKLRSFIYVTGFTLEHAPRSILPNGEMKSAPRKFNVWGLEDENDPNPVMFGDYEFVNSDESLQYFPVQTTTITKPYEYIELRVHSNHGQLEYTCLYRFRVHGRTV